jgi:hypothetical protein
MTLLMPLNIYCHLFWFQNITLCVITYRSATNSSKAFQ